MSTVSSKASGFKEGLDPFVSKGVFDQHQVDILEAQHLKTGKPLEALCTELGFLSPQSLASFKASLSRYPDANLLNRGLDAQLIHLLGQDFCERQTVVPLFQEEDRLAVAMADTEDLLTKDTIRQRFPHHRLEVFTAQRGDIHLALQRSCNLGNTFETLLKELALEPNPDPSQQGVNPTVRFVDLLLADSAQKRASDIHCEPAPGFVRIRYRIDGVLRTQLVFHKEAWPPLLNRLKILSRMDISESRRPQNGRLTWYLAARNLDFRLSSHPTQHGESLVIRVLDQGHALKDLEALCLSPEALSRIERCLHHPQGLIVVTGPTGAGKTTSMYGLLKRLQSDTLKMMTLEEPIEYTLPLVSQTEILEEGGMTFASGVKSILRQDPDVLLIGEIRDPETAHMALRAAMTGHRVFTTLHTQGALSAIYRLLELGLRPSFLAGHLSGIIAQRLVRQLCPACKDPVQVPFLFQRPVSRPQMIFQAKGCPACEGSGYKGRVPLAEVLLFDEQMHTWLFKGAPREQGPERLKAQHFRSLWEEGLSRVLMGQTDVAEIERVLGAPPFPLSNKDEGCHGGAF